MKEIIKIINEFKNPYPRDIFLWINKDKLNFDRGRFNEFIHNVVENTRMDIIKLIEENLKPQVSKKKSDNSSSKKDCYKECPYYTPNQCGNFNNDICPVNEDSSPS